MNEKRTLNKKKVILLIVIIIFIIVALVLTPIIINIEESRPKKVDVEDYAVTYEDGVKINTSKELKKTKHLDNLEITNIVLSYKNGTSTLLADVINKGNNISPNLMVKVEFLDKEENVIMEIKQEFINLNPEESLELNVNVSADITNAYNFRITKE